MRKVSPKKKGKQERKDELVLTPGGWRSKSGQVTMTRMNHERHAPLFRRHPGIPSTPNARRQYRSWLTSGGVLLLALVLLLSPGRALPPTYSEGGPGWDDTNIDTAFERTNRRGAAPVVSRAPAIFSQTSLGVRRNGLQSADELGSANFQLTVPIVGLPGRGLDLALNLTYNSHVWHESKDGITYDIDADWPGPGWSLGFGKLVVSYRKEIVGLGPAESSALLLEPDGMSHSFVNTGKTDLDDRHMRFFHYTTDGSLIQYFNEIKDDISYRGEAKYPNGMQIEFASLPNKFGELYPTRIIDANGNYIKINYRNNVGPQIVSIIDTLGRQIDFHYDTRNRLTAITGPALGGGTRTLVRLHYMDLPLRYAFAAGVKVVSRPSPVTVIDAIYFPGSGTGYWFGDLDSYSSYGMLAKASQHRAMSFKVGPEETEQGTICPGVVTREQIYSFPLHPEPTLTHAPTYTMMTETWDAMDTPAAVTHYVMQLDATPRRMETTYPDGTRRVELSYNHPSQNGQIQFDDGLPHQNSIYTAAGELLQQTTMQWRPGERFKNSPLLSRVEKMDLQGQVKATQFNYWSAFDPGGLIDGLEEVLEYDYVLEGSHTGGNVMRRKFIQYETDPGYNAQYIRYLPKSVGVYEPAGDSWSLKSLVEYRYDSQPLQSLPTTSVVGHDGRFNPDVPAEYDKPTSDHRGNVTEVKKYADALDRTGAVTETRRYDITGNLVEASSPECECEQESFEYAKETQYAYPTAYTRGAPDPTSSTRITSTRNYDFGTGLVVSITDTNGSTQNIEYFADSLRPHVVWWSGTPGLGHSVFAYDDAALTVTEALMSSPVPSPGGPSHIATIIAQTVHRMNGLGLVRRQETRAEENTWDVVETEYDALGRLWKQTQPFRAGEQMHWSERSYDGLGRLTVLRAPDGSEFRSFYDEATRPSGASSDLGERVRSVDPAGRERWSRTDALGRLTEVVEPAPDGDGSVFRPGHMVAYYSWNALDRLEKIRQGTQTRRFRYDSLGRLTHQALPEKLATLNDVGTYVGPSGEWSDVFAYDDRSNLTSSTDARGVRTILDYKSDPLNRLQSVSYDASGFGDNKNPIMPAASVSYEYMTSGDVTRLWRVTTSGVSNEEYGYDTRGRLSSKTLTMTSHPSHPLVIDYIYDSTLNRLTDIRYPAEYGVPGAPRRSIHYEYGLENRAKDMSFGGAVLASGIVYNSAGQATSLKIGPGGPSQLLETFTYDPATGWLDHQQVQRGRASLLDLTYKYGSPGRRTGQLTAIVSNLAEGFTLPGLPSGNFTLAYQYDTLGRLKRLAALSLPGGRPEGGTIVAPGDEHWSQSYSYDGFGNRTGVTLSQGLPSSPAWPWTPLPPRDGLAALSYDPSTNRITTSGFEYDAAGNLTRSPRTDGSWQRLQYDAAGRLARVLEDVEVIEGTHFPLSPVVSVETYTYGADRRRLVAERGTFEPTLVEGETDLSVARPPVPRPHERSYYAWDGNSVIAEYAEAEASSWEFRWARSYVYFGQRLLAMLMPGSNEVLVHYIHPHRLGRLVTAEGDGAVTHQTMLPYGAVLRPDTMATAGRIFASYDRSSFTGLDYAVNRYYEPQQGRFTQVDPLGVQASDAADPQNLNLYSYVRNDPPNGVDPEGLKNPYETVVHGNREPSLGLFWFLFFARYHTDGGPPSRDGRDREHGDREHGDKETAESLCGRTPAYVYNWKLGPISPLVTPEKAMTIFQNSPNLVFPFEVHGLGGEKGIVLGGTYDLRSVEYPGSSNDPVRVISSGPTSFAFLTLPGHFRGAGEIVAFRTYSESGYLYLEEMATTKGGFLNWVLDQGAKVSWNQQAENLKAAVYGGERADFPGVCHGQ